MENLTVITEYPKYSINRDTQQVWSTISKKYLRSKKSKNGYYCLNLKKDKKSFTVYLHRLMAQTFLECKEGKNLVDHINRNRLDNRIENLRWVNSSGNSFNRVCKGYAHVKNTNKYRVRIAVGGRKIDGGYFDTIKEAKKKYKKLKKKYHKID